MNDILPHWLERWLGVDAAGVGEGTAWTFESTWSWAPWVTLLFVLFAVLWVGLIYARENPTAPRAYRLMLALLRIAILGCVLLMIAEVMLSLKRTGLPTIAVLIDDSASMGIADRYDDAKIRAQLTQRVKTVNSDEVTRFNLAKSVLIGGKQDLLSALEASYQLKLYSVSSAARGLAGSEADAREALARLEPNGEASRLGDGILHVLGDMRGSSPAAIVLISDGINTEGESLLEAARFARRKGVPLFTVAIGSEQPVRDIDLSDLLVDEVVFVDDIVNFECKVSATGLASREVEVHLREKDKPEVLASTKVTLSEGAPTPVRLPYRPTKVGQFEYVVEVEPLSEEARTDNNRQQRLVSVRKEQIRVLLVQAYPNYEFRYLKNMLQRDSTIELKTVLQDADLEYSAQDETALSVFPVRREELFEYDVVIFGDVNPSFLSTTVMQNLREFVEQKGGGIAFIAGPLYTPLAYRQTPLAALFPCELESASTPQVEQGSTIAEGYRVVPTDLGLASPVMQLGDSPAETARIWRDLPELYWLLETPHLKPGAHVLGEHPTRLAADGRKLAVISLQYVGAGKVLFQATDDTWRWRFRVGDVFFSRYWVQAVRYLSRSKLLGKNRSAELSTDRREYRRGEAVRLRLRFNDERAAPADDQGVTITVEHGGRKNESVTLTRNTTNRGVFEGILPNVSDGNYHLWVTTPTLEGQAPAADFLVRAPPGEFERVETEGAELARAAEETRGRFYRLSDVHRLAGDLPLGHQVPIESLPPKILWNQPWFLSLVLGLLVSEWILRKYKGML